MGVLYVTGAAYSPGAQGSISGVLVVSSLAVLVCPFSIDRSCMSVLDCSFLILRSRLSVLDLPFVFTVNVYLNTHRQYPKPLINCRRVSII